MNPQDTATHCTSAALAKNGDKLDAKFTAIVKNSFGAMRLTVLVLRRSACAPLLLANVRPYLVDMIIGRRHFIQSAIAGASLLAAPSTAADMVFVPGTGNNNAGSVPPLLLSRAKAALDCIKAAFAITTSSLLPTFRNRRATHAFTWWIYETDHLRTIWSPMEKVPTLAIADGCRISQTFMGQKQHQLEAISSAIPISANMASLADSLAWTRRMTKPKRARLLFIRHGM